MPKPPGAGVAVPAHGGSAVLTAHPVCAQHYMASLLAAKGLEEETDCIGALTYIHWWGNWKKMQPETYVRDEVCGDLIEQMRCARAPALLEALLCICALRQGLCCHTHSAVLAPLSVAVQLACQLAWLDTLRGWCAGCRSTAATTRAQSLPRQALSRAWTTCPAGAAAGRPRRLRC